MRNYHVGQDRISFRPLKRKRFRASNGNLVKKAKTKSFRTHFEKNGIALASAVKTAFVYIQDGWQKVLCPYCRYVQFLEFLVAELTCSRCSSRFFIKEGKK